MREYNCTSKTFLLLCVCEREERELWFTTFKEQKLYRKRETKRESFKREKERNTTEEKAPITGKRFLKITHPGMMRFAR